MLAIKKWLRLKLWKFLELDKVEKEVSSLYKDTKFHRKCINQLTDDLNSQEGKLTLVDDFLKCMNGGLDIGMKEYHKNWAVIAVQGKGQDFVKFIDLSNLDYKECMEWVKRMESMGVPRDRHKYDAPLGIKDMFLYPFNEGRGR